MLDFQRIHFSKKKPWKHATPFAQLNYENKSFEPDHQILSQCLIRRFLTVITNFLGALSQKEDDFSGIVNQALRIFWFQALRKPRFENKGNFWINCVCTKALRVMIYLQGGICIHCIPTSEHLHHDIPTWTFTSWHTYMNICIIAHPQWGIHAMAYSQADIRIMAYSQGDICIHCIPKRAFTFIASPKGHSHHDMHQWDIRIMEYSQADICIIACTKGTFVSLHITKRTFAS